jgi:hypothetical protein
MELVLDIEADGETRRIDVGLALTDPLDVARVINLCGADALARLGDGEWVIAAAKAILYVNLIRALADGSPDWDNPPFAFDDVDLDWGELSEFMVELDPEMETSLAAASESLEEE